jgi:hypothetical protein
LPNTEADSQARLASANSLHALRKNSFNGPSMHGEQREYDRNGLKEIRLYVDPEGMTFLGLEKLALGGSREYLNLNKRDGT